MWGRLGKIMLISGLVYVFSLGGLACNGAPDSNTTGDLPPVEVREYEGENLSSIHDFRENSIKGPQQIDIETYRLEITGLVSEPLRKY